MTILCSRLPICVLLQRPKKSTSLFPYLPNDIFPVFPTKSTLTIRGISVSRLQIPMTPGFAVTDYKIQGATFRSALLDLRRGSKINGSGGHKRFCSTYVQLSRRQSLDGVQLLERIQLEDIDNQPHSMLVETSEKLDKISAHTLESWIDRFDKRRHNG